MSSPHNVDTTRRRFSGLARLFREPLLQFFAMGEVLFVAAHGIAREKADASRRILVDSSVARHLTTLYETQTGTPPSPAKLDALVDAYVREEVLYREAVRMGLDQDDAIVRRRLTQKIEFLERSLIDVPDPSEAALDEYYEQHAARFTEPASVTFRHIYFSPDVDGSAGARRRAEAALRRIESRHAVRARDAADPFPLQHDYAAIEKVDVAQLFGQFPIVDTLFSAPTGCWIGPVESGYGWHLVFISRRKEPALPPLAQIKARVKQAYLDAKRSEANEQKLAEMERAYSITRVYGSGAK